MAKEKIKPFESVRAFLEVQAAADKANGLLKANQKWFEKRFGEAGGSHALPDGTLTLSVRLANGQYSTSYKGIVEGIESAIREGKLYQMDKDAALRFFEELKAANTVPQMASQKIKAEPLEATIISEVTLEV
jgi:hypothetical protein